MYDLNDHPMAVAHAVEQGADTPADHSFSRYLRRLEALLGVRSLDGDELVEGYSLDSASAAQDAGISPEQYAAGRRTAYYADRDAMRRDRGL